MPNPSTMERDCCPDCLVLEREILLMDQQITELKRRLAEHEHRWRELDEIRLRWNAVILNWIKPVS